MDDDTQVEMIAISVLKFFFGAKAAQPWRSQLCGYNALTCPATLDADNDSLLADSNQMFAGTDDSVRVRLEMPVETHICGKRACEMLENVICAMQTSVPLSVPWSLRASYPYRVIHESQATPQHPLLSTVHGICFEWNM